jgi:hypothetical protein
MASDEDDTVPSASVVAPDKSTFCVIWEWAKEVLFIVILLAVLIALGVVVFQVITTDTSLNLIPTSGESAAVIRTNERVVQLTQWTISTILIVAGGLIGLNWYQNQRRYERDKEDLNAFREATSNDVTRIGGNFATRLERLEQQNELLAEQHRDHVLVQAVDEVARSFSVNHVLQVIMSWYDRILEVDDDNQERALTLVWQGFEAINELLDAGEEPAFFFTEDERRAFDNFLDRVEGHYPEMQEFLTTYRTIAESWAETIGLEEPQ